MPCGCIRASPSPPRRASARDDREGDAGARWLWGSPPMGEQEDDLDYLTGLTLQRNDDAAAGGAAGAGGKAGQRGRRYFLKRNADPELVISACTRKLSADPRDVRALHIRATCRFKLGRYADADEDLTLSLAAKPDDVQALFLRGRIREKVRARPRARRA